MRKIALATLFMLTLTARPGECLKAASPVQLRIGLVHHFAQAKQLTVSVDAGTRVVNQNDQALTSSQGEWRFSISGGALKVATDDADADTSATLVKFLPSDGDHVITMQTPGDKHAYQYRGVIEIKANPPGSKRAGNLLQIVNVIDVETYLRGVVAREMSESDPPEALRAQAVIARTYALKARGKYPTEGYDLRDNTECQVYDGVNAERTASDEAISDTRGMVVVREGALVFTDYGDDCGGVTAPNSDDEHHATSVIDRPADNSREYCAGGVNHTWMTTIKPTELSKLLPKGAGDFVSLGIITTDESGRATKICIAGEEGKRELTGEQLRSALGYNRIKSTLITISQNDDGSYLITGKGYGHGQGLCQTGAVRMAKAPYNATYQDIIAHYFPGADIEQWAERAGIRSQEMAQSPSRSKRASSKKRR